MVRPYQTKSLPDELNLDTKPKQGKTPIIRSSEMTGLFPTGEPPHASDDFDATVRKRGFSLAVQHLGRRVFTPKHGLFDIDTDCPEEGLTLGRWSLPFVFRREKLSPSAAIVLITIFRKYCMDTTLPHGELFSHKRVLEAVGGNYAAYSGGFRELLQTGVIKHVSRNQRPDDFEGAEKPCQIKNPAFVAHYRIREHLVSRELGQQILSEYGTPEQLRSKATFAAPLYAVGFSTKKSSKDHPRFLCIIDDAPMRSINIESRSTRNGIDPHHSPR